MAQGLCRRCYLGRYVADNRERIKGHKRRWYAKVGGKEWAKVQREQRHFDGKREAVLRRDGYRCVLCGSVTQLLVHHKDGQGRGSIKPNNRMSNLVTICYPCHIELHRDKLQLQRGFSALQGWSKKHGLDGCKQCGSSDRKHASHGLCIRCYQKKRFHDTKDRRVWVKSIRRYILRKKAA